MKTELSIRESKQEATEEVRKVEFWLEQVGSRINLMFSDSEADDDLSKWWLFTVEEDGSMIIHEGVESTFIGNSLLDDQRE